MTAAKSKALRRKHREQHPAWQCRASPAAFNKRYYRNDRCAHPVAFATLTEVHEKRRRKSSAAARRRQPVRHSIFHAILSAPPAAWEVLYRQQSNSNNSSNSIRPDNSVPAAVQQHQQQHGQAVERLGVSPANLTWLKSELSTTETD
ncbi:uncharacterized protein LOC129755190 [Uranotaenia lowii]|nr:uncharacterized protein LOC129755190 [Uranotaenia lowii]